MNIFVLSWSLINLYVHNSETTRDQTDLTHQVKFNETLTILEHLELHMKALQR